MILFYFVAIYFNVAHCVSRREAGGSSLCVYVDLIYSLIYFLVITVTKEDIRAQVYVVFFLYFFRITFFTFLLVVCLSTLLKFFLHFYTVYLDFFFVIYFFVSRKKLSHTQPLVERVVTEEEKNN